MPRGSKQTRDSGRVQGPASTWPADKRLEYHLVEMAMHLHMIETILNLDGDDVMRPASKKAVLGMRVAIGKKVRAMYRILELNCPNVIKQSHTWGD